MGIRDGLARLLAGGTKASVLGLTAAEMPDRPLEHDFDDAALLSTYRDDAWPYILANKIGEQASQAPLQIGRLGPTDDDFEPLGPAHPLQRLFDAPQQVKVKTPFGQIEVGESDGGEFIHLLMLYMELVGHAPIEIVRARTGREAVELRLINPGPWRIVPNRDASIKGYLYQVDAGDVRWAPDRMTYLRWPNPNNRWYGQGRIAAVRQEVMAEEYAAVRDKKFEKQFGVPPGILTSEMPIGETTAEELRKRWEKAVGGYTNAGRIAVLGSKTTYQAVALSHRDAEWLKQRGWRLEAMAASFGIGMPLIRMEGATFSNLQGARAELWEGTLEPRLNRIARMITIKVLPLLGAEPNIGARFDYTKIEALGENDLEAAKTAGEWSKTGAVTVDEVRARLNLPPHANADIGARLLLPSTLSAKSDEDITAPPEPPPAIVPGTTPKPPSQSKALKAKPDRDVVLAPVRDEYRKQLAAYFDAQFGAVFRVTGRVGHETKTLEDDLAALLERVSQVVLGKRFRDRLRRISEGPLTQSLTSGAIAAASELAIEVSFVIEASEAAVKVVGAHLERMATGIEQTTIAEVSDVLAKGLREQWTNDQLRTALGDLYKGYADWRVDRISRTETAAAYNVGSIGQYRDAGVTLVHVVDGDGDNICAEANGSTWTLEEAEGNPLGHPNCTRTWIPDTSGFGR